jgi:hypothetical protein
MLHLKVGYHVVYLCWLASFPILTFCNVYHTACRETSGQVPGGSEDECQLVYHHTSLVEHFPKHRILQKCQKFSQPNSASHWRMLGFVSRSEGLLSSLRFQWFPPVPVGNTSKYATLASLHNRSNSLHESLLSFWALVVWVAECTDRYGQLACQASSLLELLALWTLSIVRNSLVQWLRLTLSKGPNRVGVSTPLTWGWKQIQFPKRCVFWYL